MGQHDDMKHPKLILLAWWYVMICVSIVFWEHVGMQPVQDIGHFMIRDVCHRSSAHQTPNPNYQILCKMQPGGHLITTWQPNMKPLQDTLHSTWLWLSSLIRQGPQRTTPLPDWGQAGRYIQSIPAKHFFGAKMLKQNPKELTVHVWILLCFKSKLIRDKHEWLLKFPFQSDWYMIHACCIDK